MAYTELTVQAPTIAGVIPADVAATLTDGNRFKNSGREFILVKNGGGVNPVVVTIPTPQTIKGLTIQDPTVSVAIGVEKIIGPFPPSLYNNPAGGTDPNEVYLEYDQITSVTVSVFRV
jgi:hypothetical protein